MFRRVLAACAAFACALLVPPVAAGTSAGASASGSIPHDRLRAADAVPPGESGTTTMPEFLRATSGLSSSYGPHTDDQEALYASFHYKPMQFEHGPGTAPPGDPRVTIWRDRYGVPTITAASERDAFYGIGYAMAQDRLFQMEVFRHVGHGTLAQLIGAAGLPMDEAVRRYTEGDAALHREFQHLPGAARMRVRRFVDGVNAWINQVQGPQASRMPAEFTLLGDQPIRPWTVMDVLRFGEYAGRFFGEFGHGELADAATYLHLVHRYGKRRGLQLFNDLFRLQDPHAPTSISRRDGRFPRHVGPPVPGARYRLSRYVNDSPRRLRPVTLRLADRVAARAAQVSRLQRILAIPRFGSNAILVSGRHTTTGRPMLYGGPQTGWAVPGFFWEAEVHDPVRDQRGVMVPDIPLFVIGRNATSAWTVTSALDANADTFVQRLDRAGTHYRYRGRWRPLRRKTETIPCRNPPTAATSLPNPPQLCPATPVTITVYRTVHGPAIADPSHRRLFVRDSTVDHHLLSSLVAWDRAGRQQTARRFGAALRDMSLGFNFFYVDDHNQIAYWHTGRYPIRPANVDPRLPIPGGGRFDWEGVERFRNLPHVLNPTPGYLVNWNNKPAAGWSSKNLETGGEGGIWGDSWESVPLQRAVPRRMPISFHDMGQLPKDVAYVDGQAVAFKPYLIQALRGVHSHRLRTIRRYLRRWNDTRKRLNHNRTGYATPAVAYFDRFVVYLLYDAEHRELGRTFWAAAGLDCHRLTSCGYHSVDNLSAPTYKFEYPGEQLLLAALRHQTRFDWVGRAGGRVTLFRRAARQAAADLARVQGSRVSRWNEPVEVGEFSPQGAISVPPLVPLPNRGSYAQVVEAGR